MNSTTTGLGDERYDAGIAVGTHGVVHVTAGDWGSLGYAQGWACGRDNLAVVLDQVVKATGRRARYHGEGPLGAHVAGDLGYAVLGLRARADELRRAQPPWIAEMVTGYVAGLNRAVAEADPEALPAWARDSTGPAEWIAPVEEADFYAHLWDVTLMASGRNLVQLLGRAEAPGPDGPVPASPVESLGGPAGASNGWALGGEVTASGGGMVLANPHFPWYGEARFWECHLRIPGTYDVYGVSLLGTPGVQIGFNRSLAWTHTFSTGHRFTLARLELEAGNPTRYRHGDRWLDMVPEQHEVQVAGEDGPVSVQRTLWRSHHGPMVNLPLLGWGTEVGFTFRDANAGNTAVLEQFLRMGMASSVGELRRTFHEVKGLPWVNTLAADAAGDAWYTDASATPALSQGAADRFVRRIGEDLVAALLYQNGIALLDGSDPDDDWIEHPGARSPGVEPPEAHPELHTRSVVLNANDSHWLNAPGRTLTGYTPMAGLEGTARTLRTRQNLRRAEVLSSRGDLTTDDLLAEVFSGASLSAELLRDQVVDRCRGGGVVVVEGHECDLDHAADVLAAWDGTFTADARGAVLWREVMGGFDEAAWRGEGALFGEPFDPTDPVGTPRDLAPAPDPGDDPVLHAVGHALRALAAAGIEADDPLGSVQWGDRDGRRIPLGGGGEGDGVLDVVVPTGALPPASLEPLPPAPVAVAGRDRTGLGTGGYRITYGTSFLMAVELTPEGPRGSALLTYGQSSDPGSPHHADGMEAFAARRVRPLRYTDTEIAADPALLRFRLQGPTGT